jgi:hypothetical protein
MKRRIAFALIMGFITTGIISFTLISINVGFGPNFAGIWFKSWGTAYILVIPVILTVGPLVQIVVNRMIKEEVALNNQK